MRSERFLLAVTLVALGGFFSQSEAREVAMNQEYEYSTNKISASPKEIIPALHRDTWYEETLRYEASADRKVTPAKVINWMRTLMGYTSLQAPSKTEFQPTVDINETRFRIIAAIAYKF